MAPMPMFQNGLFCTRQLTNADFLGGAPIGGDARVKSTSEDQARVVTDLRHRLALAWAVSEVYLPVHAAFWPRGAQAFSGLLR